MLGAITTYGGRFYNTFSPKQLLELPALLNSLFDLSVLLLSILSGASYQNQCVSSWLLLFAHVLFIGNSLKGNRSRLAVTLGTSGDVSSITQQTGF